MSFMNMRLDSARYLYTIFNTFQIWLQFLYLSKYFQQIDVIAKKLEDDQIELDDCVSDISSLRVC